MCIMVEFGLGEDPIVHHTVNILTPNPNSCNRECVLFIALAKINHSTTELEMKKKTRNVVKVTTKPTPPSSEPSTERKLKIVYWVGAIVLVGVKIYVVLHGLG